MHLALWRNVLRDPMRQQNPVSARWRGVVRHGDRRSRGEDVKKTSSPFLRKVAFSRAAGPCTEVPSPTLQVGAEPRRDPSCPQPFLDGQRDSFTSQQILLGGKGISGPFSKGQRRKREPHIPILVGRQTERETMARDQNMGQSAGGAGLSELKASPPNDLPLCY